MEFDLNEVSVFIKVVQKGSFSGAARDLGMPNSTVSAKVSQLEARLGLTLIQRTTRKLNITPAGKAYFDRCIVGLEAIHAAESELLAQQGEPHGSLRITAPVELGSTILPVIVAEFTKKFKHVKIEVILTDRRVDLLGEGIDLAVRAGDLKDSSLIAKNLGRVFFAPYASAKYLKAHGMPSAPRDFKSHEFLKFTPLGDDGYELVNAKTTVQAVAPGRLLINDLNMIKNLALSGSGIAFLPSFFCKTEVETGKLIRVLPDWSTKLTPVHFVYPAQRFVPAVLSAFIELATPQLRESLQI